MKLNVLFSEVLRWPWHCHEQGAQVRFKPGDVSNPWVDNILCGRSLSCVLLVVCVIDNIWDNSSGVGPMSLAILYILSLFELQ